MKILEQRGKKLAWQLTKSKESYGDLVENCMLHAILLGQPHYFLGEYMLRLNLGWLGCGKSGATA